jgi:hypothetical protein
MRALYAGALCEVVESPKGIARRWKIHGRAILPPGYNFRIMQKEIQFTQFDGSFNRVSNSQSLVKSIVAIFHVLFSCVTLYRTRGNQIQLYGYAAFWLTVTPYAVMSLINTIANILTPNYPIVSMVRTPKMTASEAEEAGGKFEGIIANVDTERSSHRNISVSALNVCFAVILSVFAYVVPYIVLKVLSGFGPGCSTSAQRGWIMAWLVANQALSIYTVKKIRHYPEVSEMLPPSAAMIVIVTLALFTVPAIGGCCWPDVHYS